MTTLIYFGIFLCICVILIGIFTETYEICGIGVLLLGAFILIACLITETTNCDCCNHGCVSTININKCEYCNHSIDKHSNCSNYENCKEEKEFNVTINCKCHECKVDDLGEQNTHLSNCNHENNTEEVVEEVTSKERYCSSCGMLFNKKDNFCSSCGKKRVSN